jgi:hypothetical protein
VTNERYLHFKPIFEFDEMTYANITSTCTPAHRIDAMPDSNAVQMTFTYVMYQGAFT